MKTTRHAITADLRSHRDGATAQEIALRVGKHVSTVRDHLNRMQVKKRVYYVGWPRVWKLLESVLR